jgi:uncharacterized membrane protein
MDDAQGNIQRIDGELHQVTPVRDESGTVVSHHVKPLQLELSVKDMVQIIVGATILAIPMAFTEEVWDLGSALPWISVVLLALVSLLFSGMFIYLNSYQHHMQLYRGEFFKRLISTYLFALVVVGLLLMIVDKAPWASDFSLALKRTIIGTLPASMSATVTDAIT